MLLSGSIAIHAFTLQLDEEALERALTAIDLSELSRLEGVLNNLLDQKEVSSEHYLYYCYLGRIFLRQALYYESKSKDDRALFKTSERLINKARDQFKQVVRKNKDFSDGYVYLANAYAQKIKYVGYPTLLRYAKRVDKNVKKALEIDPANPRAYLVRGIEAMYKPPDRGGGVDRAIPFLLKSVTLNPTFHEGYYWLARAYVQNDFAGRDEKKANDYLEKALKLAPDDYFYKRGLSSDVQVPSFEEVKKGLHK